VSRERRIGLLGGTFDPIHNGHIQLAQGAKAECDLDEIIFIPAAMPPHKDPTGITPFADRVAMLGLVCESNSGFSLSTIESKLPHPSYTIATLEALKNDVGGNSRLYFIIGSDSFLEIQTWHRFQDILDRFNLIVARRDDHSLLMLAKQCLQLGYEESTDGRWLRCAATDGDIMIIKAVPINCSATEIKKELQKGRVLRQCLTDKVAAYIINHKLYQGKIVGEARSCSGCSANRVG